MAHHLFRKLFDRRRLGGAVAPLLVAALVLSGCGASTHHPWLQYAVEEAASQKKLLVLEFGAKWCKPCQHFEADVLVDARVQRALEGLMFIRYDIDTPSGRDAYLRCSGRAVPTFVAIDGAGHILLLKQGTEPTPDGFLEFLTEAHRVEKQISSIPAASR